MISSLSIQGYRGFEHFEMPDLGRINLLVGTNNSGKTSILEAVSILESSGDIIRLWNILYKRGERTYRPLPQSGTAPPRVLVEADLVHVFHGHELHPGTRFSISATNESPQKIVKFEIRELLSGEKIEGQLVPAEEGDESPLPHLALDINSTPPPTFPVVALTKTGGISANYLRTRPLQPERPIQFISTESSSAEEIMAAWNKISLKPEEELVLRALRSLDKDIEGIALQARVAQQFWGPGSRGGFNVKLKSSEQPVPIGSMGDGIWRMLALSMAIALSKGGTLLIDEIDTGLHYTVMSKMWNLIYSAAKEFNVQVFATTHSYDCVYSLAQICPEADSANRITVQRIEANKRQSVPYDQEEITVAAAREIEVR
jgi:hypothetical protein